MPHDFSGAGPVCPACLAHWLRTAGWSGEATAYRAGHPVFARADCPTCGGGERVEAPDLTVHCSAVTGIVQEVEAIAEPIGGAYLALGKFVSPYAVRGARPALRPRFCAGRGATREQAIEGCIGEAIERYSLVYRGDEPMVRARWGEVAEAGAIDPREILLFSEAQYDGRVEWNARSDERFHVPERFDPERAVDWLEALDLTMGTRCAVPAACCLMWYQFAAGEPEFARADSIGCASGRTFEDALTGALLEWIERDATAIWWYNMLRRPSVRLESFDSPLLLRARAGMERLGRTLHLLDVMTDIGVPAYVAIAAREDGSEPLFAAAAHPSPQVAAWKAASEVAQICGSILLKRSVQPEIARWLRTATFENQPYLVPSHEVDAPREPSSTDRDEMLKVTLRALRRAGLRPIAVDQTRSDTCLKTVRAIVPGLRHIWDRKALGRLYRVPVDLGWRAQLGLENALNPICCMI